jgi:hypothetical protein
MFDFEWNTPEARGNRERIRAVGRGRYILTRGVLMGVVGLVVDLAVTFLFGHPQLDFPFVAEKLLKWGLFGPIAAWWFWHIDFESREDAG